MNLLFSSSLSARRPLTMQTVSPCALMTSFLGEDVFYAFLLEFEFGNELVAALQRCLELHVEACHYGVCTLFVEFGEAHSVGEQELMACVLDVVLVVGVVDNALKVAFVVSDLHL